MARRFLFPTLDACTGWPARLRPKSFGGPGIGYPGGQLSRGTTKSPRRAAARQPSVTTQPNASTLTGILHKIDPKDVILESDDQAISTVSTPGSTKYTNASGGNAKIGDFQPGDHVRISVTQDDKGNYKAQTIAMVREGTLDEHAAASQATDDPHASHNQALIYQFRQQLKRDPYIGGDRPQLRRAGSSSGDDAGTSPSKSASSSSSSSPPATTATPIARSCIESVPPRAPTTAPPNSSSPSSNSSDDSDRPKLRRASSSSDTASSNSSASSPAVDPAPADANSSATISRRRSASASFDKARRPPRSPSRLLRRAIPTIQVRRSCGARLRLTIPRQW